MEERDMSWQQVTEQISKRVDSLEALVMRLVGHVPDDADDQKIGKIPITTWIALFSAVVLPLIGIAVAILGVKP